MGKFIFLVILLIISVIYLVGFFPSSASFNYKAEEMEDVVETGQAKAHNLTEVAPSTILADKIIECESNGRMVMGDLNYPYPAYGIIQVQERTWLWLSEKMDFEGSINNADDQRRFLIMAIEQGYGRYWSCFRQLK